MIMSDQQSQWGTRPTLRDVLYTLFRYRTASILSMIVILIAGAAITWQAERIYEVKGQIYIETASNRLKLTQSEQQTRISLEELVATEVEIIKSLPIIESTLAALAPEEQPEALGVGAILAALQVTPVRNTSLIEITFETTSPAFGRDFVNQLSATYIDHRRSQEMTTAEEDRYQSSLNEINSRIQRAEEELRVFSREHSLRDVAKQQQLDLDRLSKYQDELYQMERALQEFQASATQLDSVIADFSPAAIPTIYVNEDRRLATWIDEFQSAEQQRMNLSTRMSKSAPELQRVNEQLDDISSAILMQVTARRAELDLKITAQKGEISAMRARIEQLDDRTLELSLASSRHDDLNQQLNDLRNVRTTLQERLEETRIQSLEAGRIRVEQMGAARMPENPIKPSIPFNIAATLLLVIGVAFSLPFYLQFANSTVFTDYDVTRTTGLRVLCSVREVK